MSTAGNGTAPNSLGHRKRSETTQEAGADTWVATMIAPYSSVSSLGLAPAGGVLVTLILTVWDSILPLADLTS